MGLPRKNPHFPRKGNHRSCTQLVKPLVFFDGKKIGPFHILLQYSCFGQFFWTPNPLTDLLFLWNDDDQLSPSFWKPSWSPTKFAMNQMPHSPLQPYVKRRLEMFLRFTKLRWIINYSKRRWELLLSEITKLGSPTSQLNRQVVPGVFIYPRGYTLEI